MSGLEGVVCFHRSHAARDCPQRHVHPTDAGGYEHTHDCGGGLWAPVHEHDASGAYRQVVVA